MKNKMEFINSQPYVNYKKKIEKLKKLTSGKQSTTNVSYMLNKL